MSKGEGLGLINSIKRFPRPECLGNDGIHIFLNPSRSLLCSLGVNPKAPISNTTCSNVYRTGLKKLYPSPPLLHPLIGPPLLLIRRIIRPHLLPRLDPPLLPPPIALLGLLSRLLQVPLIILAPIIALHASLIDAPPLIGLRLRARSALFDFPVGQKGLGSRWLGAAGSLRSRGCRRVVTSVGIGRVGDVGIAVMIARVWDIEVLGARSFLPHLVSRECPSIADCSGDQIFGNIGEGQILGIEGSIFLVGLDCPILIQRRCSWRRAHVAMRE